MLQSDQPAEEENDSPSENLVAPRKLGMRDQDIWSHTHRMYLLGQNSMYLPWYIPKDFPNSSLSESDQEKLILMINHKQSTVDWSKCQMFWYILSRIVCPPISDSVHRSIRRRHFNLLQDEIYKTFNLEFWAMNGS